MRLVAKTDVGKLREENQDDYRASIVADGCAWAVVCDGMGGANGGAAASSLAVTLVEERCRTLALAESTPQQLLEAAAEIAVAANSRVYAQACQQPALRGMGTTMVLALVANGLCTLASVGDSRVYLYREGVFRQLTKDHSIVQEMVERGMISQQEADVHPQKNVITRAVGIQPQVAADCMQVALHKEDMLLLCTDGLTNALTAEQIEDVLRLSSFYDSAARLIDGVLQGEAQDNATVVLLSMAE